MNKESSIKQLKRIKQDMIHADDVNALDFAIRFMENRTLDKIRAEIERKAYSGQWSDATTYGMLKAVAIIDKYREG